MSNFVGVHRVGYRVNGLWREGTVKAVNVMIEGIEYLRVQFDGYKHTELVSHSWLRPIAPTIEIADITPDETLVEADFEIPEEE